MTNTDPVVIVGAGHAGVQVAASLRDEGYGGAIVLMSDEAHPPYQRPPLSKAYLKGTQGRDGLALRGPSFYGDRMITTIFGDKAAQIDRATMTLACASGRVQPYAHLVLATGARGRPAPFPGAEFSGVFTLRNLDDADALKAAFGRGSRFVVIGAGFIGLEFAATAAAVGKIVTVVEATERVMGRAVSPTISDFFAQAHRDFGATLLLGVGVTAIEGRDGALAGVRLSDGRLLPADAVLLGIGVLAEDTLARACGLDCTNGIVVDAQMRTSDPAISAVGDCCFHPNIWHGGGLRLESVQNATDQARIVARRLLGHEDHYRAVPWFWSDQGDLKLQIAGLLRDADTFVVRGDPQARAFSVFAFAGAKLRAVESVNKGGDHLAARRIIGEDMALLPAQAADPAFDLKGHAMGRTPVRTLGRLEVPASDGAVPITFC